MVLPEDGNGDKLSFNKQRGEVSCGRKIEAYCPSKIEAN